MPERTGRLSVIKPFEFRKMVGLALGRPLVYEAGDAFVRCPDWRLLKDFREMAEEDDAVGPALEFVVNSVMSRFEHYEHKDQQIELFINEQFERLPRGAREFLAEALFVSLWAGFAVVELIFGVEGKWVTFADTLVLPSEQVRFKLDKSTKQLDKEKGIQQRPKEGGSIDIPPAKCLHLILNPRQGTPYGYSMLRRVHRHWKLKAPITKMGLSALDNQGNPMLACYWPDVVRTNPTTGNKESFFDIAKEEVGNLYGRGSAIHIPVPPDPDSPAARVEVLVPPSGDAWKPFDQALTAIDLKIMRGLLIPTLIYQEGQRTGSLSLGKAHYDFFERLTGTIYEGLMDSVLNQIVKPLVEVNFGPQANYGKFPAAERAPEDIAVLAGAFKNYIEAGGMPEDPAGMAFVAKIEQSLGALPTSSEEPTIIPPPPEGEMAQ